MTTVRFFDHYCTDGTTKARIHYSLDNRAPGRPPCVTMYAQDYSDALGVLFPGDYVNRTELQSDYFDKGSVNLEPGHPSYEAARAAALLADARRRNRIAKRDQKRVAKREARLAAWRSRTPVKPLAPSSAGVNETAHYMA